MKRASGKWEELDKVISDCVAKFLKHIGKWRDEEEAKKPKEKEKVDSDGDVEMEEIEEKREILAEDNKEPIPRQSDLCEFVMNMLSRKFDYPPSLISKFNRVNLTNSFPSMPNEQGGEKYHFQTKNCL